MKRRTLKPSTLHRSWTVHVIVLGQNSFIEKIKENTSSRCEGMPNQKMQREERERERARGVGSVRGEREKEQAREREQPPLSLWLLFLDVFFFFLRIRRCKFKTSSTGDLPNPGIEPSLLHCRQILYQLTYKGNPRILEWVAYTFSRGSSCPRNQTGVSCIASGFFTN